VILGAGAAVRGAQNARAVYDIACQDESGIPVADEHLYPLLSKWTKRRPPQKKCMAALLKMVTPRQ
jgi:hypothetical protein